MQDFRENIMRELKIDPETIQSVEDVLGVQWVDIPDSVRFRIGRIYKIMRKMGLGDAQLSRHVLALMLLDYEGNGYIHAYGPEDLEEGD